MATKKHHWLKRHQHISNGQMVSYGESGDETYWYEYWKARLNAEYYASAEKLNLAEDELGKVLLQALGYLVRQ